MGRAVRGMREASWTAVCSWLPVGSSATGAVRCFTLFDLEMSAGATPVDLLVL